MIRDHRATDGRLSLSRLCGLVGLDRSLFYRPEPNEHSDMALRDKIQRLALSDSSAGYRRITRALHRRGIIVNAKRVLRIMREDNLLCVRRRAFVVTTDSDHNLPVYPNLARGIVLQGIDELWVADITYVWLRSEFVYLAVVLDAFSRRCLGWALERNIDAQLAIAALQMALRRRGGKPRPGLIHHSDRGCQYASRAYREILEQHKIRGSMSRRGNPYDNAKAESFIKTLKHEQTRTNEYHDLEDARLQIGNFIERVYNKKRLHSSLGYRPPHEFEQLHKKGILTAA
jgi:putative transposase